ncbi:MAG: hypothetical protein RR614_15890, partial [Eubacterium sp.]
GRVRLELDASDTQLLDRFKSSVTRIMRNGGASQSRAHNHYEEASDTPYDDDDDSYEDYDDRHNTRDKRQ